MEILYATGLISRIVHSGTMLIVYKLYLPSLLDYRKPVFFKRLVSQTSLCYTRSAFHWIVYLTLNFELEKKCQTLGSKNRKKSTLYLYIRLRTL